MEKRYQWKFWYSKAVGEELELNKQVTGIEPSEFMRRSVLMAQVILEHLDMGRSVMEIDGEGNERSIADTTAGIGQRDELVQAVPRYTNGDVGLEFFIPEERAYAIELLAEKMGVEMDTFGMFCLLLGRHIVQNELANGSLLLMVEDIEDIDPIPFLMLDDLQWAKQ